MKTFTFFFSVFFISCLNLDAQMMGVLDPNSQWNNGRGSIENLQIDITPIGAFTEIAYTFDVFNAEESQYAEDTPLEFIFEFQMPEGITFNDSWLWIDDYISKGVIYEKGEGTSIYEGIVDRQQDPSILSKHSDLHYDLRIYPLLPDSTRRVKISYLQKMELTNDGFNISIGTNIFKSSKDQITNVTMQIHSNDRWLEPELGSNYLPLASVENNFNYEILNFESLSNITIPFTRLKPNSFLQTYTNTTTDEHYYQLLMSPETEINETQKHFLFLLDYEYGNSYTYKEQIISDLIHTLNLSSNSNHLFNIVYSDFSAVTLFDDWMPLTNSNISIAENELFNIDSNSNLLWNLEKSIDIINNDANDIQLFIISNDDTSGSEDYTREFINFIDEHLEREDLILNIIDYADRGLNSNYINGDIFKGNDFLYTNLNLTFPGQYLSTYQNDQDLNANLGSILGTNTSYSNTSLHVSLENGFTYENYNIDNRTNIAVGKFHGDGNFEIEFAGFNDGEPFIINETIEPESSIVLDTMTQKIWSALFIDELEESYDNQDRLNVIGLSKEERLLSKLTTFLCLEPDFEIGEDLEEDDPLSSTVNQPENIESIVIAPNPVIRDFTIEIELKTLTKNEQISIEIVDTQGRLIDSISEFEIIDGKHIFKCSLDQNTAPGIYFIRIITADGLTTRKLIKAGN